MGQFICPVPFKNPTEKQVKDLENTISNLRKLLTARENEVVELKDQFSEVRKINDKLQGDLDRHRARASPGPQIAELERKVHEACSERDNLNMEVLRLKEELKQKTEPGLNSYDPNSPSALQRKIDELNSQIQDLHEAHDAASEEIHAAERKVKELAGENETLRVNQSERLRELEDENRYLKMEIQRLKDGHVGHSDATDYRYKIELQQVKEDNRNLRERNYQLHDDNIRAKEELSDLRKTIEFMGKKVQKEERGRQFDAYERNDIERILKPMYQSDLSSSRLSDHVTDRRTDRRTDRDRESYTLTSNYDLQRIEPLRDDSDFKEERFTKSEANRYESYRTGPDGGSSDKLLSSLGYSRPLTPERPSALGPSKRESLLMSKSQERVDLSRTFDRSDIDYNRARRERSRTTSGEIDLRTTPLAAYHSDLSKTTPALSGRSRAIYNEISDQRSKSKAQNEAANNLNTINCESVDQNDSNPKTETVNNPSNHSNQAHTSQVFMNRFVPKNQKAEVEESHTDSRRLHLAEKVDPAYGRREAKVTHQREALEKQMELLEKQAEKQALLASLPIVTKSGYCDDGDTSDTPTDILVNIAPVEKIAAASWSKGRQRRGSVGSDASNSSFSDIDEQITASVRKRSKSADGREVLRRMGPTGSSGKENTSLTRTLSPAPSAGLRSVTLRPIATQHNKSALSLSSSLNSLTQGLRPFAPRSAQDLQIHDVIKFSRQGGKLSQGTIKFIGHLPGRGDIYLGVELDKEDGKHDGVFEGIRYFKCKPSKGVFVAYNKVVMAWTSYLGTGTD